MATSQEYTTKLSQLQQLEARISPFHLAAEMLLVFVGCAAGWHFLELWPLLPWFAATYTLLFLDRWLLLKKSDVSAQRRYRQHLSLSFLAATTSSAMPLFLWFQSTPALQFAAMTFLSCAILNTSLIRTQSLPLALCYFIPNSMVLVVMAASHFWHPLTSPVESGLVFMVAVFAIVYMTSSVFEALRQQKQHLVTQRQLGMVQKFETLGTLSAGIAHDFNNLLGVLSGNLELLRDENDTPAARRLISNGLLAIERATSLTERLLHYGGEAPLQQKPVEPSSMLIQMSHTWRLILPVSIEFETQIDDDIGVVILDEDIFRAVLSGLFLNAYSAIDGSGSISIRARRWDNKIPFSGYLQLSTECKDFICISVIDSGCGIEPDLLTKVFDPYFSSKHASEGAGLGLAKILGFVKQSGGDIRIQSDLGERTVIDLLLPIVTMDASRVAATSPNLLYHGITKKETHFGVAHILIVEDEAQLLDVISEKLMCDGYAVSTASTGDEGVEYLAQGKRFDLVLTDVVMPGTVQGLDLVERFAAVCPDTKFIVMSGYMPSESWATEVAKERTAWLRKPTSLSTISHTVTELLNSAAARRDTGAK